MPTVEYDYSDETVIVTGGSSGIGRATALSFADAGATVLNADLQPGPKDREVDRPTHEAIRDAGGTAEYVETDVTDPGAIAELIDRARDHGGVDVMINNAGLQLPKPMREVTLEELQRIFAVNVFGVFMGCQAAANDMIERSEPGVILNTASISSNLAQHDQVQYDATKGAIRMITRGCALELAEEGIRVNGVAPGQIATEFTEGWSEEAVEAAEQGELLKPVPLGRAGRPEDVAGAFLYLASDTASYVTGELIHVDGGWQVC